MYTDSLPNSPAGCLWTEAVSGKKKLWIQKYPDTCGGDLIVVVRESRAGPKDQGWSFTFIFS